MQWSAEAASNSTAMATPGPCPSWFACSRGTSPAARPAVRISRVWSASNAPRSQKTSTNLAYGAHASSIGPVTSRTYSAGSMSAGTTWAPRNVTSSTSEAAMRTARSSCSTVRP